MEWLIFLAAAVVIAAIAVWQGVRRGRQLLELDKSGSATTAKIVRRRTYTRKSGRRYQIVYEFQTSTGSLSGSSFLTADEYASTAEGGPLQIKYLPQQAKVSAPLFTIAQAVEAAARLKQKKQRG